MGWDARWIRQARGSRPLPTPAPSSNSSTTASRSRLHRRSSVLLFVSLPAHDDAAVSRHGADLRPTRPERRGEDTLSAGVDDDRKIDLHTPVHGPRFELGRV